jgi:hypothetical protein
MKYFISEQSDCSLRKLLEKAGAVWGDNTSSPFFVLGMSRTLVTKM